MFAKISDSTIQKITDVLLEIRTEYPEAYNVLDEDPITLIIDTRQDHTEALLEKYLSGLYSLLESFPRKRNLKIKK